MSKNIKWLFAEIDKWVQKGIIDPVQGKAIKNPYPVPGRRYPGKRCLSLSSWG